MPLNEVAPSRAQAMAAASLGTTRGRTGDLFAPRSLYPDAPPLARLDMLRAEKEAVGVYLTGHPLDGTAPATPLCGITDEAADGDRVVIRVLVTEYEEKSTKGGKGYAILTVEDETGVGEIMAWPRAWGQAWKAIEAAHKADSGILLRVVLHSEESEDGDARWKMELEQAVDMAEPVAAAELVLQVGEDTDVVAVVAILRAHPGPLPVRLVLGDESAVLAVRVSRDVAVDRGLAGMGVTIKD
jgi:DNA polymerase-3 subunit alpha